MVKGTHIMLVYDTSKFIGLFNDLNDELWKLKTFIVNKVFLSYIVNLIS